MRDIPFKRRKSYRGIIEPLNKYCEGALSPLSSSGGNSSSVVAGDVISNFYQLEVAATNLLLQSATFSNASWTKTNVTVTADTTAAPNGVTEADTLADNSAAAKGTVTQAVAIANDGVVRNASVYLTAGTSLQCQIGLALSGGTGVSSTVDINPVAGTILAQSGTAATVTALVIGGVNWFRVSIPVTNNTTGNVTATMTITPDSASVAGQGTVIAWGAQIETDATPSSQIPTTTASVARVAGKIPSWIVDGAAAQAGTVQVFTAAGANTYTRPANLRFARVTIIGGGGAGGGAVASGAGQVSVGVSGAAGGASIRYLTAAQIGASQTVTIGAKGAGASGTAGTNGGTTSFGALLTATGGTGGTISTAAAGVAQAGVAGGLGATGDVNIQGQGSGTAQGTSAASFFAMSAPGNSMLGGAPALPANLTNGNSANAAAFGSGGTGTVTANSAALVGGDGCAGICIVEEFY